MRLDRPTVSTMAVIGAICWCSVSGQQTAPKPIAGLVSELSGTATISPAPGARAASAQRFDAMSLGATVATGPESRALLVLAGGQRFELGANARATIGAKQLTSLSGPIKELPAFPPLPQLAALDESPPKGPAGGIRLRGNEIPNLRPSHGATLADRTTLRFGLVSGASRYGLEIENDAGKRIFSAESTTPELIVPAGVLEPHARYYWTVRTLDKVGAAARGAAEFRTVSADDARLRRALRGSLEATEQADALALLAEVDRRLGLYQEALDGFRAALLLRPDDVALQQAVRRLENLLEIFPETGKTKSP